MKEIRAKEKNEIQDILASFGIRHKVPYSTPREILMDPLNLFSKEEKVKIKALMGLAKEIS